MPARDRAEFMAAPIGRCVIGPSFVIWCAAPDLAGTILWGALDDHDVREMMQVGEFIRHPSISGSRCALVDARDLERVDGDMLLGFTTAARDRMPQWSRQIRRQAVVVPEGLSGILVAGGMASLSPTHPLRAMLDLQAAFDFLDHPAARDAHAAAMALSIAARGRSALIGRLRSQLALDLIAAAVEDCAGALGFSARTLQRELHRLGTSFSDELRRARVAAAEEMLRLSDVKIESIATRVGFGTSSRMSAALRRELSVTASELRARVRPPLTSSLEASA